MYCKRSTRLARPLLLGAWLCSLVAPIAAQTSPTIWQVTTGEPNPVTPEVSTEELQHLLESHKISVLDVRSAQEYAIAHIPGTTNLYEKEVEQVTRAFPDKAGPLVLYCNGPFCGKSKRLSQELVGRGYTNVRRYQLGLPVWRALGNTVQTDLAGARYILAGDKTAVWVDARESADFARGSLPGAVNIRQGEAEAANEDGRLPKKDKGTRVVVFADTPEAARQVATEVAHKAYWNSSYFGGSFRALSAVSAR
ncbi:MAG TPA: rhodanese-like domain-containing protein [Gemmatimonadales bacterium]|jgi:rhodanese-related sulfurtransferase